MQTNPIIEYWEWKNANPDQACEKISRQLDKLVSDISDLNTDVYYDEKKANHAIEFAENFCRNIKGRTAGKLIELDLWEKAFLAAIFGICYKATGLRRCNRAVLIVAKKNGKSVLASIIGLYMLIADGEGGPEVFSAATTRDQAKIIWNVAKKMIAKDPQLRSVTRPLVNEIHSDFNDGIFKPLASEADTLDGHDIHCALMDEIQQWKRGYELYDILYRGMGNRDQPLALLTSTAGTIREDFYDILYLECANIIRDYDKEDGFKDEQLVAFIYELDERDEWKDFSKLIKANPGLGTIRNERSLRQEWEKTLNNPELNLKTFLTKNCNIPETSSEAWLTAEDVKNPATFNIDNLKPDYVIGGVDMSSTTDLTCITLLFVIDGEMYADQMYFIPEDVIKDKEVEDKVPYEKWAKRGLIQLTPGNKISQQAVFDWLREYCTKKDIVPIWSGFDTWGAELIMNEWKNTWGQTSVEAVIQGAKTMSAPMKELKADLQAKRINYNANPILQWCLMNTSIKIDDNGNIRPIKGKSRLLRIDGMVSLLNAYIVYKRHMDDYLTISSDR